MQSTYNRSEHRQGADAVEQNARSETFGEILGIAFSGGACKSVGKPQPSAYERANGKANDKKHRILALRHIG